MPAKKIEIKKAVTPFEVPKLPYPINTPKFCLSFNVTHQQGHQIKLKYDWFRNNENELDIFEQETVPFNEW